MHFLWVGITFLILASPLAAQSCVGDCDCDRAVTVDELLGLSAIALGGGAICQCPSGACPDGGIAVPCIVTAINNALHGCSLPASLDDGKGDGAATAD